MQRLRLALQALKSASSPIRHTKDSDCPCEACYAAFELEAVLDDLEAKPGRGIKAPSHYTYAMAARVLGVIPTDAPFEVHHGDALLPAEWVMKQLDDRASAINDFMDSMGAKGEMLKRYQVNETND